MQRREQLANESGEEFRTELFGGPRFNTTFRITLRWQRPPDPAPDAGGDGQDRPATCSSAATAPISASGASSICWAGRPAPCLAPVQRAVSDGRTGGQALMARKPDLPTPALQTDAPARPRAARRGAGRPRHPAGRSACRCDLRCGRLQPRDAERRCAGARHRPRSRCGGCRPCAGCRQRRPVHLPRRALFRTRQRAARRGHRSGRWRGVRYRRLLDAARSGRAWLLVPERWSARHAHGPGRAERGGFRQHRR